MLCDRYLDELADTFEAGFAATTSETATVDAAVWTDEVCLTAWLDGARYRDSTFTDSIVSYYQIRGGASTLH